MGIPAIVPYAMPGELELPENRVEWWASADRAVLLLHDMQSYFLAPYPQDSPLYDQLITNAGKLRDTAAELGVPVVYSAQPGSMDAAQRGLLRDFWGPGMRAEKSHTKIVDELRPGSRDRVLTKWRYSAFIRSGLDDVFAETGRDQLIVSGVYAHVGCLMTSVDAFSSDIQPFFVADAVADFSEERHRAALDYAAQCCSMVLSTAQVLSMLHESPPGRRQAADRTPVRVPPLEH